ncbi:MAG: hypothetical protein OXG82_15670 [Gammaproteobacteria bacterium]|nr:hypothetical protein [Gammaproteobacteria bacterium]
MPRAFKRRRIARGAALSAESLKGRRSSRLDRHGGAQSGASAILTWNHRNFAPFAGDIRIETPA